MLRNKIKDKLCCWRTILGHDMKAPYVIRYLQEYLRRFYEKYAWFGIIMTF